MPRKILVATDGSDGAARAVDFAAEMAAKMDGALTVVHVLLEGRRVGAEFARMAEAEHLVREAAKTGAPHVAHLPTHLSEFFEGFDTRAQRDAMIAAVGDVIVDRAAKRARELGAGSPDTRVLTGDTAETLVDLADAEAFDIIVVGSRGLGPLKRMVMGSVSEKIVTHAHCTVVTVR